MRDDLRQAFDAQRDLSRKGVASACYAPYTSLYFDQFGTVRTCCHNVKHSVGNIADQSIRSIWDGESLQRLRDALAGYDFGLGCQFCEWRLTDGHFDSLSIAKWDQFDVPAATPTWPKMMEFSLSNSCNLECVMCNGDTSSAVRARRERRPPMRRAYREAFFQELEEFLPHLDRAQFLGGEPFLQPECYRIWEMMRRKRLQTPCHITTNGTLYNRRIEQVLESLPVEIAISMDGASSRTVEAIKVGASHAEIMAHFRLFHAYARRKNTGIGLTFCLMRQNWHELGEFCRFADDWDCHVYVNTVRRPAADSLYALPLSQLSPIIASMGREASSLLSTLGRNLGVWVDEFERLRAHAKVLRRAPGGPALPLP